MDPERIERLKRRYRFAEWSTAGPLPPVVKVDPAALLGPEWVLHHVDVVEAVARPAGVSEPVAWQAVWHSAKGEQAVSAYLRRCDSPGEAREHLLSVLDQFQSPQVERAEGSPAVGEIAFAPPGDRALAFAASNLVTLVRSVGRDAVGVRGLAATMVARLREASG